MDDEFADDDIFQELKEEGIEVDKIQWDVVKRSLDHYFRNNPHPAGGFGKIERDA